MSEGPLTRLRNDAVRVVSMAVTAVWLAAMFTGQDWWLAALLVGYVFVVPVTKILAGEDDEDAEEWAAASTGEEPSNTTDEDDALETLRRRYAQGELTEAEFERKVERLLATEDPDDVETLLDAERDRVDTEDRA